MFWENLLLLSLAVGVMLTTYIFYRGLLVVISDLRRSWRETQYPREIREPYPHAHQERRLHRGDDI